MYKKVTTIDKKDYVILFYRKFKEEKVGMTCTSSITYLTKLDEFYLEIRKFRINKFGREVADCISESYTTKTFDTNTANMLWFNLKNMNLSFEELRKTLAEFNSNFN